MELFGRALMTIGVSIQIGSLGLVFDEPGKQAQAIALAVVGGSCFIGGCILFIGGCLASICRRREQ
jgi:hypothetical protein